MLLLSAIIPSGAFTSRLQKDVFFSEWNWTDFQLFLMRHLGQSSLKLLLHTHARTHTHTLSLSLSLFPTLAHNLPFSLFLFSLSLYTHTYTFSLHIITFSIKNNLTIGVYVVRKNFRSLYSLIFSKKNHALTYEKLWITAYLMNLHFLNLKMRKINQKTHNYHNR